MTDETMSFSAVSYAALVRSYLIRQNPISPLEWLPVAMVAADVPERWIAAFQALTITDQYDFIDLLTLPGSGPLAGALLLILAEQSGDIQDEQIQQIVCDAASGVLNSQAQELQYVSDKIEALSQAAARGNERLKEEFRLELELTRLQSELAVLRSQEMGQDERFAEVHSLEHEILRMETRKRLLDRYDAPGRQQRFQELQAEVEQQDLQKKSLEAEIETAASVVESVRGIVQELEENLKANRQALAETEEAKRSAQEQVGAIQITQERNLAEIRRLQAEGQKLSEEAERLEEEKSQAEKLWGQERDRLRELQEAAIQGNVETIRTKIEEVYRLLPSDKADQGFATKTRRKQ